MKVAIKNPLTGDMVDCYGKVRENSNFHLVCDAEEDDGVWADGNPESEDGTFTSWAEVVRVIQNNYDGRIIEIGEV